MHLGLFIPRVWQSQTRESWVGFGQESVISYLLSLLENILLTTLARSLLGHAYATSLCLSNPNELYAGAVLPVLRKLSFP